MHRLSLLAPVIALLLLGSCSRTSTPAARQDHLISTDDLGIQQYTFQGGAPAGQVLVFRGERYIAGKLTFRLDVVTNTRNEDATQRVKLVDLESLDESLDVPNGGHRCILTSQAGGMNDNIRLTGTAFDMPHARMEFDFKYYDDDRFNAGKEAKYVYTMFTEPWESAVKRIPDLASRDISSQWSYSKQFYFDK